MTLTEFQMLIYGIGIGAQGMAALDMIGSMRGARRGRTEAETARKQTAGDLFHSSFRLYQLQQRSRA
ncbi:hypothetical protein [Streptomyces sp. NPDC088794]|uniref:hypothetical protein n=1 Tax=Streptomyces sp. NPDC088794 TaxID=3365902 RepID=UPI003815951B